MLNHETRAEAGSGSLPRAAVAAKIATLKHGGDRSSGKFAAAPTQRQAAAMMNVSECSVRDARVVLDTGDPDMIAKVEHGELAVSAAANIVRKGKPATAFKPGNARRTLADIEALSAVAPGVFDLKVPSPPSERANFKETVLAKPYSETAKKYFAPQEAKLGPIGAGESNAALPLDLAEIKGSLSTLEYLELRLARYVMTDFNEALALAKRALESRLAA